MIKLCIFDLDGTLVNSLYDLADSMNYALEKNGFATHDREKYRVFVGNGISTLADRAMVIPQGKATQEQKEKILSDFKEYYNNHCMDNTTPYSGITELLDSLDSLGIQYSVMSNKPDFFSKLIVNSLFPNNKFASVWGQRENFERKPSPQAVLALISDLNVSKDDCLYIGDSDVDFYTAKNAGLKFCGVSWGFRPKQQLIDLGAPFIADNALEILQHIKSL